jgi:putative oligomerization/nucleic acid binding protein
MFGRKRKKDADDPLGLSSIGTPPTVVPAASPPAADASGQQPPTQTFTTPAGATVQISSSTPVMFTSGMQFGGSDALKAMFTGKGPIADLVKEIQSDPQAFRNKMLAQMQAAGVSTMMVTPQGYQQLGATPGASAPQHVDVIEELTKAADLHDKGALTDAEFEALKHKLLGH